jgi:molybdate-binding protein
MRFAERRQGLLLSPGNPLGIRTLADLPGGPRLVNRQPASGTRLLFDRLLRAAKVEPTRISGYDQEEFTHLAVAATIAAGQADVGFGIEAAAAQYRLDFVPLARTVLPGAAADHLHDGRVVALIDYLASPACRELIGALPGYRASHSGSVIGVDEVLPAASATVARKGARRGARLA